MQVEEDRGKEVELAYSKGFHIGMKIVGATVGILAIVTFPLGPIVIGPLALWFWKIGNDRRTIRFNDPPGYITVDYYRWSILGAWSFFKDQKRLPLIEAKRYRSKDWERLVQTDEYSAYTASGTTLSLPDGEGNSFDIWSGNDREVGHFLEQKILAAINEYEATAPQPADSVRAAGGVDTDSSQDSYLSGSAVKKN